MYLVSEDKHYSDHPPAPSTHRSSNTRHRPRDSPTIESQLINIMARGRFTAIVCTILLIGTGSYAWLASNKAKQRVWPSIQMERAIELATLVSDYRSQNGDFPSSLDLLVASGMISKKRFAGLQFQTLPNEKRSAWIYRPPSTITDFAIVSPDVVIPWKGSFGIFIVASPDGGAQMIDYSKRTSIESLLTYQAKPNKQVRW